MPLLKMKTLSVNFRRKMNIINVEVVNTGDGCLITTIEVSSTATNIQGLKIIGINEEGIGGYSSAEVTGNLDDVLFVAETYPNIRASGLIS
ncbi:hypothetical protein [Bacillus sp. 37MA]|uniref:hypothetical protein n=1 Tax=Bacillus sp. 37MA TaxID=1132442 RepID=UPI00036F6442|nr:hypothetical protein [Bacillus sp. 37MA]